MCSHVQTCCIGLLKRGHISHVLKASISIQMYVRSSSTRGAPFAASCPCKHPLRCVRAVGEKDPQTRRKPGSQSVFSERRPKNHSTLKATNGMPARWLKDNKETRLRKARDGSCPGGSSWREAQRTLSKAKGQPVQEQVKARLMTAYSSIAPCSAKWRAVVSIVDAATAARRLSTAHAWLARMATQLLKKASMKSTRVTSLSGSCPTGQEQQNVGCICFPGASGFGHHGSEPDALGCAGLCGVQVGGLDQLRVGAGRPPEGNPCIFWSLGQQQLSLFNFRGEASTLGPGSYNEAAGSMVPTRPVPRPSTCQRGANGCQECHRIADTKCLAQHRVHRAAVGVPPRRMGPPCECVHEGVPLGRL